MATAKATNKGQLITLNAHAVCPESSEQVLNWKVMK